MILAGMLPVVAGSDSAAALERGRAGKALPAGPSVPTPSNRSDAVVTGPVRFVPLGGTTLREVGESRYRGVLEVAAAQRGGLALINELGFEEYLKGIAEVPGRWPAEALKAQAVAARTYALWDMANGRSGEGKALGYDICATTACQVYRGAENEGGLEGAAWSGAVDATAGLVATYDGKAILARYHSTSGGRTRNNEDVFTSEGPRPYLKAVESTSESDSPLYRWSVTFERKDLASILSDSNEIGLKGELVSLRSVRHGDGEGRPDEVVVSGSGGDVTVRAGTFARVVSREAKKRWPSEYPPSNPSRPGSRLPDAVPSSTFGFRIDGDSVVIDGAGWGHGVGMSQYGAEGMASAGASAEEILRHYYTGISIDRQEMARSVRVLIGSGAESVSIDGNGEYRVEGPDGKVLAERVLGKFTIEPKGKGASLLHFPRNIDAPLALSGMALTPPEITPDASGMTLAFTVSKPAIVTVEIVPASGGSEVLWKAEEQVYEAGSWEVKWPVVTASGHPPPVGQYVVRIGARSPGGQIESRAEFAVRSDASAGGLGGRNGAWMLAAVGVIALLVAVVIVLWRSRRRRGQGENGGQSDSQETPGPVDVVGPDPSRAPRPRM